MPIAPKPAARSKRRPHARKLIGKPPSISLERYRAVFDVLTEGVVMISAAGKVLATNPSAQAILGMDNGQIEEALRKDRVWGMIREDDSPFSASEFPIRKTLRTGKPLKNVLAGIRPEGRSLRWLAINTQPVFSRTGKRPAAVVASFEDVTRQRRAEVENARLAAAVNASPDAITSANRDSKFMSWNPGAERLFGYPAKEIIGTTAQGLLPESRRAEFQQLRDRVLSGEIVQGWSTERTRADGRRIHVESSYAPIRDTRGEITGIVGVHRDVSQIKKMLAQIESSEELFRLALNGIPDVFLIYDRDLRLQFVNERGREFFARGNADILGKRDDELLPPDVTDVYTPVLARARDTKSPQSLEITLMLGGRLVSLVVTYVPTFDEHKEIRQILGLLHDITQRRQTEERLAFMAQYDSLTGLPNRYLLLDRLDAAMQRARRNNTLLGVMLMDIDRFKQINDTRGHATGDILLQQVAERLAGALRATDTIARLGGDEFTVLVENASAVDEITAIADKIKNAFAQPFETESGEVFTTTSLGITIFPFDDTNRDQLIKNADVAMYYAKQERNSWQLYRSDMNAHSADRLNMEVELRHALTRHEFELAFQPQVEVRSGRICGVEALIRWNNSVLGGVSPADFIPLAEDSGLIVPVGEWILRAACKQCKAWEMSGMPLIPVSVNLSATQFRRGNLLETISGILGEYQLDPAWLALEITESGIMKQPEETIRTLSGLRDIGVAIAIDDFGTGYSRLGYLKRFPVNKIKVDQSFVRDISIDPNDAAIVSAMMAMAKQLGLKTIAEGVETAEQLAFLARLECDEYQGHYFSEPLPANDVEALIRTRLPR